MIAILVLVILLVFLTVLTIYFCYELVLGSIYAPFVPSSGKEVDRVLEAIDLKNGMKLIDLGSGDGRVVLKAARDFGIRGVGVERNPFLVWFARWRAKALKIKTAEFARADLYAYPLKDFDIIYIFLMPRMMKRIGQKLNNEAKIGTLLISRGFKVPGFKPFKEVKGKYFDTYFYKL